MANFSAEGIKIQKLWQSEWFSIGLAMFSMFFGAGNVIFPLAIGQLAGDKSWLAISGLLITGVFVPLSGVIAMILFEGNQRVFFSRLGRIPGFLLALLIISLLGPFGSTPRCIALSYSTLKNFLPEISTATFSAWACLLIWVCAIRKNRILPLLGRFLTPLLLFFLTAIILIGIMLPPNIQTGTGTHFQLFLEGLKEGYYTMDLLAAFFFSSTIITILDNKMERNHGRSILTIALKAAFVSALLLALIYIGFSTIAAFHGQDLDTKGKEELLTSLAYKILGDSAGLVVVCTIVALACLTTAIALISAFADFIQKEIFQQKISYKTTLTISLIMTYFISTWEFTAISSFLGPILQICYPGLIVLTLLNIAYQLFDYQPIKWPVFLTFTISMILYLI